VRARGSTFVVPTPANENPNLYHVQPNEGEADHGGRGRKSFYEGSATVTSS